MLRFHLGSILKRKGWTPYRLARETGLTTPTAYRLADPLLRFGRFTADTLDRLCAALGVQPGDLLEWVATPERRGRGAWRAPVRSRRSARPRGRPTPDRAETSQSGGAPCTAD